MLPIAEEHDHEDKFPDAVVEQMKELGLFGVTIPEEYGGMGLDLTTYAMIVEELSRGWISISGIVNTHFIGSYLLMKFGTDEQKEYFLPKMATGEIRAAFSLSEPESARTSRASRRRAKQDDDGPGSSTARRCGSRTACASGVVFVLDEDRPEGRPALQGHDLLHHREGAGRGEEQGDFDGLEVPPQIKKMGYKGVESTELVYDGYRCPPERILGGEEGVGQGFGQMMDALEVGRVNVAARGVGIAQRALELALATRRSARRSASRSPSTRRSSSSSPTWPPRSRPRACSPARPRG